MELTDRQTRKWLNKQSHAPPPRNEKGEGLPSPQPLSKIQGELCGDRDDRDRPRRETEAGLSLGLGPEQTWELVPTSPLREEVAHTVTETQTHKDVPCCLLAPLHTPAGR